YLRLPGLNQTSGSCRNSCPRLEACNPLQWRNRPRFSRGFLTPGCDKVNTLFTTFKERFLLTPAGAICQANSLTTLSSSVNRRQLRRSYLPIEPVAPPDPKS